MKVYRITPDCDCNSHCEDNLESAVQAVETWLSEGGGAVGQYLTVEIIEMSREAFDALPEYDGP